MAAAADSTSLSSDPWWIFTTCSLFYNIKSRYDFGFLELIHISPRFGILLASMLLSIAFTILDILSVTDVMKKDLPAGINPFWELSFVFKLLTDTVVLDDFKTALDRLHAFKLSTLSRLSADDIPGSQSAVAGRDRRAPSSTSLAFASGPHGLIIGPGAESSSRSGENDEKPQTSHAEHHREVRQGGTKIQT
jgi:hypothetical protein